MYERLVIPDRTEVELDLTVQNAWWSFSTRFNVAASHSVPVARLHDKESEGVMMKWGLVPAEHPEDEPPLGTAFVTNDGVDTLETYRRVWLHGQRCIVPLAGFYLWQRAGAGHRQPFYVRLVNRAVFGVAAIWDRFVAKQEDDVIEGCALVTVPANSLLAELDPTSAHMPAILARDDYESWLRGRPGEVKQLLRTYPAERMVSHAVGPFVNFLQYDEVALIQPIARKG